LDPSSFFSQARVFIITGKGGTGKTTVCGVMANVAARAGLRVVVVQVATASDRLEPETAHLSRLFGQEGVLGYEELLLRPGPPGEVRARALRPDTALVEYLHLHGMKRLSKRLLSTGALEVVATAVPGMPDMLVLGKVKQMERTVSSHQGAPEVVLLDAPAAGHAVRFLQSPRGLLEAAATGPVRAQARDVVEMLSDPSRCQVVLVTTPEETPVSETIETAQLLEDRVGVKLCAVAVNSRLVPLDLPSGLGPGELRELAWSSGVALADAELESLSSAGRLRRQRQESQAAQVARLARELPLPQLELPFIFSAELGPAELEALTDALEASVARWQPVGLP
jgi:anion-transporting  ArsA/GET3 family ATPase